MAAKTLPACPVETTLTLISDKWKVLILRDLLPGTKRFGELKKSVGNVSQKVLTAQLRQMEDSGLLTRTVYPEVPPRVEYTLTELGYSLKPILTPCGTGARSIRLKSCEWDDTDLPRGRGAPAPARYRSILPILGVPHREEGTPNRNRTRSSCWGLPMVQSPAGGVSPADEFPVQRTMVISMTQALALS